MTKTPKPGEQDSVHDLAQDIKKTAAELLQNLQEQNDAWAEAWKNIKTEGGDHRWKVIKGWATKEEWWALVLILPNPQEKTPVRWLFIEKQEGGYSPTYF